MARTVAGEETVRICGRGFLPGALGLALLVAAGATAWSRVTVEDLWPLYVRSEAAGAESDVDREYLWPVWQWVRDTTTEDFFFRPLGNTRGGPGDRRQLDLLWPLYATRRSGERTVTQILPLVYGQEQDGDEPSSRFLLLPVYFTHRQDEELRERVVFPLYGHLEDRFNRDTVDFWLFPLWLHTRKGDYTGTNVCWPFYGHGLGEGKDYRRIFPLWGRREDSGKSVRSFYLWPLVHHARFDLDREEPGRSFYLFPLYGYSHSAQSRTTSVIPPLFNFQRSHDGRSRHTDAPWPFIQRRVSPAVDAWRVWPLAGSERTPDSHRGFTLWPLVQWGSREEVGLRHHWEFVTPMWYSRADDYSDGTGLRRLDVWPLVSYVRDRHGDWRWRLINPLPIVEPEGLERAYGPLYSVVDCARAGDDVARYRFLWRAVEYQREEDVYFLRLFPFWSHRARAERLQQWQVLVGALGWERGNEAGQAASHLRLFWVLRIPLG